MWILLSSACLFVAAVAADQPNKNWGPFDIDFQEIAKCSDEGTNDVLFENLQVKMSDKRTFVISLDVTSKITIDNNVTMIAEIATLKDGIYGPKVLKYPIGPACDAVIKYFPKSYQKLYASLGIEGCPLTPNTWKIKKFPMELELPINQAPYKQFRVENSFYLGEKRLTCIRCFFATVPEGTVKY